MSGTDPDWTGVDHAPSQDRSNAPARQRVAARRATLSNLGGNILRIGFASLMLISASAAPAGTIASPSNPCTEDIAASTALIGRLYPGYRAKIARHGSEIASAHEKALAAGAKAEAVHDCDPILFGYLQSFHEGHLFFLPTDRKGGSASSLQLISGDAPSARPLSRDTFYIRVPSFFPEHRAALEALLRNEARAIDAHPFLVIDVRGNHGGADDTYGSLLPLVATGPIRRRGTESVASADIAAAWARALPQVPASDPKAREEVARGLSALRAARSGARVTIEPDMMTVPPVHRRIRRVAILIDGAVASSGEQFLLDARQSSKVVLVGAHSSGTLDYGDVRPFPLPSGERELWLPTTRSRRLPASPVDEIGIAPDVPSSLAGNKLILFAVELLERRHSRSLRTVR